jgi:hypothetical protein
LEHDHGNRVEAEIADIKANDLLGAGARVVKEQQERAIAASLSGGGCPHERQDFVVLEVFDFWVFETGRGQVADPATPFQVLGSDRGYIARECLDCGKPMVAGTGSTLALLFQPNEERTNDFDVEDCVVKPVGGAPGPLRSVAKE